MTGHRIGIRDYFTSSRVEHYALFLLAILLFSLAEGMFLGVQDNYLAWLGIGKSGRGMVEFFREIPGLCLVFILSLLHRVNERNIIWLSMVICIVGVMGILLASTSIFKVIGFLMVFNIGDHLIMPVRQSYAIHAAESGREGRALGFIRALKSIAYTVGMILVSMLFLQPGIQMDRDTGGRTGYVVVFISVIVLMGLAASATLKMPRSTGTLERRRVYFHRKFNKYYALELFYGARKQVFLTFAPYLLILKYGAGTEYIAGLLGVCALLNIVSTPIIGHIIDNLGYRIVMIGDTIILFFVCVAYGFSHHLFNQQTAFIVTSAIFVLDRIISNACIASSVYAGRLSHDREEITATLSTGLSVNHLMSVLIALAGGFIWEKLGVELLFSLAALMAVGNSLFACTLPRVEVVD